MKDNGRVQGATMSSRDRIADDSASAAQPSTVSPSARGARGAPLRVSVVGLRGVPGVQGGIETHAESLYPLLQQAGCRIEIYTRRAFLPPQAPTEWHGIRLRPGWAPKRSGLEALIHTLISTVRARFSSPDVLHIHGIGPALATPLAKLLGMRVVVTHHGRDYEREKWGGFARFALRTGEAFAGRFADLVICVSSYDAQQLSTRYGWRRIITIPNGITRMSAGDSPAVLDELGLDAGRYVLNVARHVPEKRQDDLIRAFAQARAEGWKLVLVGAAMHASDYGRRLGELAASTPGVVLAGFRSGEELASLYRHAGLFVLPSTHEGLPITLLEAIGFGRPCVASDIPANRELPLPADAYFHPGDVSALRDRLQRVIDGDDGMIMASAQRERVLDEHCWDTVARRTLSALQAVASGRVEGARSTIVAAATAAPLQQSAARQPAIRR